MNRYEALFSKLSGAHERAFIPFLMLGDPTPEDTLATVHTVIDAGADALELGVAFSDPVADGPTIQRAHLRALADGATVDSSLDLLCQIREEFPDIPIGMLIYGNVAFSRGVEQFYRDFHEAGADSILLPDVPVREAEPFIAAADAAGIDPVFIAPANPSEETLKKVATLSRGYVYTISRDGVTGTERASEVSGLDQTTAMLKAAGAAPSVVGFGISAPEHVRSILDTGAAGAISGSAISAIIEKFCVEDRSRPTHSEHDLPAMSIDSREKLDDELHEFVSAMKAATKE